MGKMVNASYTSRRQRRLSALVPEWRATSRSHSGRSGGERWFANYTRGVIIYYACCDRQSAIRPSLRSVHLRIFGV